MKDFFSRIKAKVLVGVLVLLAAMMAYAGANNRLTTAPQEVIGLLLTPLQRAAAGVKNSADSLADRYTRIDEILEENEQLREENNALEQKLLEYDRLKAENDAFKSLMEIEEDMGKMYADFKRFMTSSNGRARLPYGQEFEWTGQPNYIATSNDSLRKFIKDWSDRRYLSVEFKSKPTERLDFAEIKQLWADFVLNSTRTKEWSAWADELAPMSEEKGDRTEVTEELEIDLRKLEMLERVLALNTPSKSPACAQNHVALKTFVDWFSETMGVMEAHKRKAEIEAAVIKVYGARYSTTNYWLLSALQESAQNMKNEINNPAASQPDTKVEEDDGDDLPF